MRILHFIKPMETVMQYQDRAASNIIEALIRAQPFAFSPSPKRKRIMSKKQTIEKMAKTLIEAASVTEGATQECLRGANFTDEEIALYDDAASNRAHQLQPA